MYLENTNLAVSDVSDVKKCIISSTEEVNLIFYFWTGHCNNDIIFIKYWYYFFYNIDIFIEVCMAVS